jgi:outer membrane protein assembly factor BamB/tetratricopeptide (TPR) repeat protein
MPSSNRGQPDTRLDALNPQARKLVEAASLAGRPIPLAVAAALIEASPDEALSVGERLIERGLLDTVGDSFVSVGRDEPGRLSSVRMAYLYGELARAFTAAGYARRVPALLGEYLLRAGDAQAAVVLIDAAASSAAERGEAAEVIELIEAGVSAIEEEGVGSTELEGRLRLERAKYYQTAGWADRAAEDLRAAVRLLGGAARVDALGFLAAVEDNRQESQTAEVYAAAAIGEATAIGEPIKAGSLLLLHARILSRIGFPTEADASLAKGVTTLQERGNPYQRFLATQNMARIALDRGKAIRAEPLFDRVFTTAEDVGGRAALADAAAWLARAQFLHGHPSRGLESVTTAIELAEASATPAPIFLAHMAHSEGAARFAAYEEALEAADAMLEYVLRQLPDWENAARYLRARALLGLGRIEEAAAEVERALELTPNGINGWRWRLRIEAFRFNVLAAQGADWPKARAEDLTDELLQGQWLDIAAELMTVRAGVERDEELAKQSAGLALRLGIPTTAAVAIEAGELWSDDAGSAVASRIKETARHVPEQWDEAWSTQPAIAAALAVPEVQDEELAAAAATLQADLDTALAAAGLADPDTALSPAQRRAQGLVRRRGGRIRRGALLLGAAVGMVLLAAILVMVLLRPGLEDTKITSLPEFFGGQWLTSGFNQARTGASDSSGVLEPTGYYWRNTESQSEFSASPIVLGQKVVIGAADGQVYFLDRRKGDQLSLSANTGGRIDATAASTKTTPESTALHWVFFTSGNGLISAYDIVDASWVWDQPISSCCTPAVDGERLFVGGNDGFLHVLSIAGEPLWQWPNDTAGLGSPIRTDITLAGGLAYFGAGNDLWWVDVDSRESGQCAVKNTGAFFTPVISEGLIYAANRGGSIHVLDAESCTEVDGVGVFVGEALTVKPAVHDGIVYQPGTRGVTAYDPTAAPDDRLLWGPAPVIEGTVLAPPVRGSPVVAGGLVYFGAQNGYVYALDRRTGELVWEWYEGVPISAAPTVTDGVVYVATTAGHVIAIGGESGIAEELPITTSTVGSQSPPPGGAG